MHNQSCIFCKIAKGKVHAKVVHESDNFMAFENMHPAAPIHVLVIPKEHFA